MWPREGEQRDTWDTGTGVRDETMAHLEGIKSNNGAEILCDGWSCGQTRAFKNTMTEVRRVSALKVKRERRMSRQMNTGPDQTLTVQKVGEQRRHKWITSSEREQSRLRWDVSKLSDLIVCLIYFHTASSCPIAINISSLVQIKQFSRVLFFTKLHSWQVLLSFEVS